MKINSNSNTLLGYSLHEGEKLLLHLKPNKSSAFYFLISKFSRKALGLIVLISFLYFNFANGFGPAKHGGNYGLLQSIEAKLGALHYWLIVIIAIIIIGYYFWFRKVVSSYDYLITNQRCILRYGLVNLNTRVIPYKQISDINARASFVERFFNQESVYINCIGTAINSNRRAIGNNATRMEGLSTEESREALDIISKLIVAK